MCSKTTVSWGATITSNKLHEEARCQYPMQCCSCVTDESCSNELRNAPHNVLVLDQLQNGYLPQRCGADASAPIILELLESHSPPQMHVLRFVNPPIRALSYELLVLEALVVLAGATPDGDKSVTGEHHVEEILQKLVRKADLLHFKNSHLHSDAAARFYVQLQCDHRAQNTR